METYAILIDGGFAKRKLGNKDRPATANQFENLVGLIGQHPALADMKLHRVYYYDSLPLETSHPKPLGGASVEFANTPIANRSRQLFDQLKRQPRTALRLGDLSFEGWEVIPKMLAKAGCGSLTISHEDLRPRISQKGVDMRIGMDIAALTLKKQVQTIVLVSGDSDFVPAMKFARREGVSLFLTTLGQNVKPSMHEHSDIFLDMDPKKIST